MSPFNDQEVEQYWRLRLCLATLGVKVEEGGWADCYAYLVHPTEPVQHKPYGDVPNRMRIALVPGGVFHISYGPDGVAGHGGYDLRGAVQEVLVFVQDGGS